MLKARCGVWCLSLLEEELGWCLWGFPWGPAAMPLSTVTNHPRPPDPSRFVPWGVGIQEQERCQRENWLFHRAALQSWIKTRLTPVQNKPRCAGHAHGSVLERWDQRQGTGGQRCRSWGKSWELGVAHTGLQESLVSLHEENFYGCEVSLSAMLAWSILPVFPWVLPCFTWVI